MKAPWPYFGGKATVAHKVWAAFGDVGHYIEPFCGSCAALLARPDWDRTRHTETVNDADGHIANVWRSLQSAPDEVAKWCDWPVNHADLIARKRRLNLETENLLEHLCADETWCNPMIAGYYIWAASCWIGHGLIRPTQRPHLTGAGMGVHAKGQRPHLSDTDAAVTDPYNVNIYKWFRQLSERLRYVRVVCGDWKRVCGGDWQDANWNTVGIFFDPPYSDVATRYAGLYAVDSESVAHDVREWCRGRADRENYRIVLAGYYEEHESLLAEGWTAEKWKAGGGYSNVAGKNNPNQNCHREALFFSPHCAKTAKQARLFKWPSP